MLKQYDLANDYSNEEINIIEEALIEGGCLEEDIIEIIEEEKFCLYEGCHTLEEVIAYRIDTFGASHYETAVEMDINEIWFDTKIGIIVLD